MPVTLFSALNAPKCTAVGRTLLHRMAEVFVSMFNADVLVLPSEKPDIFQADGETSLIGIDQPTYYTSLEIKGGGDQGRKFTGSRATGILFAFAYDNIFLTFNTGSSEIVLDGVLMQGLTPVPYGSGSIDCDAIDGDNTPVWFGYTCDMPRSQRFVHGRMTHGRVGR